jgi:hypothetical protein
MSEGFQVQKWTTQDKPRLASAAEDQCGKKLHNGFDFVRTETVPLTRMNRDLDYTEWVNSALLLVKNFSSVGRIITAERNDGGL